MRHEACQAPSWLIFDVRPETSPTTKMLNKVTARILGLAGALIGGAIGYWCVGLLARQGIHAIVLPAALPGVIAGVISKERSIGWALLYAIIGVVAALVTECRFSRVLKNSWQAQRYPV